MYDAREPDENIDIKQASRFCRRNPETVRRWVWNGKLPAQKLGNQLFIRKEDLVQFCRESAIAYRAEPGEAEEALEEIRKPGEDIQSRTGQGYDAGLEISSLREERDREMSDTIHEEDFLTRAKAVRESMYARTGKIFNAEEMIREVRDERDRRAI